jgi:hypothetical protein
MIALYTDSGSIFAVGFYKWRWNVSLTCGLVLHVCYIHVSVNILTLDSMNGIPMYFVIQTR